MGKHILVVDDSASIRQMVEHTLKGAGYQVTAANDGQAALELCERSRFDCVLTDQNMPRMDGFGLIEHLRKGAIHENRPILVLTTEASEEKKAQARRAGATGWIVKPFDAVKLAAAVRRVTH